MGFVYLNVSKVFDAGESGCLWFQRVYNSVREEQAEWLGARSHSEWSSVLLAAGHQGCPPGLGTGVLSGDSQMIGCKKTLCQRSLDWTL